MKSFFSAFIMMSLLTSLLFGDTKSPLKDKWIIAKVITADGEAGVFRYLHAKPEGWNARPLSEEVSISWKYEGQMPDETVKKQMDQFEEALDTLSAGKDSCLALVMTAGGQREWCFYVRDYEAFMKNFNARLSGKADFPISLAHSHDAEWKYWHSFIDRLENK